MSHLLTSHHDTCRPSLESSVRSMWPYQQNLCYLYDCEYWLYIECLSDCLICYFVPFCYTMDHVQHTHFCGLNFTYEFCVSVQVSLPYKRTSLRFFMYTIINCNNYCFLHVTCSSYGNVHCLICSLSPVPCPLFWTSF